MRAKEVGTKQDHYSLLAQMVKRVSQDHAQLRMFIYEFARVKLRKDLYRQFVEGAWSEVEEQVRGLEAAIDRIESDFTQNAPLLEFKSEPPLTKGRQEQSAPNALVLPPSPQQAMILGDDPTHVRSAVFRPLPTYDYDLSVPIVSEAGDPLANSHSHKYLRSWSVQIIIAIAMGVAIFAASDSQSAFRLLGLNWLDQPMNASAVDETTTQQNVAHSEKERSSEVNAGVLPGMPNIPMPTEYGVYAVASGHLTELDLLPIRVPDQRIAISAAISTPSRAHLASGQIQFVVFRRDLMNNAPDRVSLRVVAQVTQALTFDSGGNAKVADIEHSWVIRNNSYPMRVAPVTNNPEMIIIRPEPPEFIFPAGRYALVLKGLAYDFTLDGPMIDSAHCLERTDALNAPIYTECRSLPRRR